MSKMRNASLGVLGTVGGIVFVIFLTQTLLSPLITKMEWFGENGILGVFFFFILYVAFALIMVPASFHKFVSGVIFGFWGGGLIALIGSWIGAILPFFIGRKILHKWVSSKLEKMPLSKALNEGVSNNGLKCVFLTRIGLVIPYPFLNYGYGVTNVSWRDYLIGNIGLVVPACLYAWWGSQANTISDAVINENKDWSYWAAMGFSVLLTIWIIWYFRKITLDNISEEYGETTGMVQEP
ncbi:MAG: TVP38/TMEM64 family protein [Candidatus Poseidoniaceae archaeon]|jgi:uncharacterized membrane protein YdjX (TVP38/TMEM64 family)|nr:TVP38/TMEM64 family protein [Candidatus Poseidoniaceae archaeon]